jgi:hypothetical protein
MQEKKPTTEMIEKNQMAKDRGGGRGREGMEGGGRGWKENGML